MTGKAYYITTLADWHRRAARFANSHFIVLDSPAVSSVGAQHAVPGAALPQRDHVPGDVEGQGFSPANHDRREAPSSLGGQGFSPDITTRAERECPERHDSSIGVNRDAATSMCPEAAGDSRRILVLIEADEGVHLSLDDDPAFEPLPHPLAQKPISAAAQSALAPHGVAPGATTFDAAETLARVHPLLRHRVF